MQNKMDNNDDDGISAFGNKLSDRCRDRVREKGRIARDRVRSKKGECSEWKVELREREREER